MNNTTIKKLYVKTHGCQMNDYDSSRIQDLLKSSHNVELTTSAEDADIVLLNTCSIREKAQEKVFHQLGRWKKLKNNNPDLIIGVGGCVASQEGSAIRNRADYVDVIFGPQTLHRLPEMIDSSMEQNTPVIDVSFPEIEKFDKLPEPSVNGASAFVSIMEGCSKYCTFCVVPYTRGEEISRSFENILSEVSHLVDQGVKEVNLLGQNVNAYRGETQDGDIIDFAELLYYIAEFKSIERIRYTTSHPVEFSDALIEAYRDIPKLVDHLHLPVQSGSNNILKLMKRGHTHEEYREKIAKLRQIRPNISLSSDFIIGFPGETEENFNDTIALIKDIGFDNSFSFIYSPRPGTPAAELTDDTSLIVKKHRLSILQDLIRHQANAISESMLNTTQRVLVTGVSKKNFGELSARTENNRIVNFPCLDHSLIGQFCHTEIQDVYSNSLRGKLIL
jgi:tRNA-2-methylthio-N6-dimethylallyladenosine synthase